MTPENAQAYALAHIFGTEGGRVNNPNDRGGKTAFGMTEAVARANGLNIDTVTREQVQGVYLRSYLRPLQFLAIAKLFPRLAIELADAAVNCGVSGASEWLQLALNALNNEQRYGPDLVPDGKIGKATIAMLERYAMHRGKRLGQSVLIAALEGQQADRYLTLALKDKTQRTFFYGWMANRILDDVPDTEEAKA